MPGSRTAPPTTFRVQPEVWREALTLADGDARRIEILDKNTVRVHNQRRSGTPTPLALLSSDE